MKKRRNRILNYQNSISLSMTLDVTTKGGSSNTTITKQRPAPRDGHSAFIYDNKMFIFGGDRHHMPFNDLYYFEFN